MMKKTWIRLLSLALMLCLLAGCGSSEPGPTQQDVNAYQYDFDFEVPDDVVSTKPVEEWDTYDDPTQSPQNSTQGYGLTTSNVVSSDTDTVRYVMIYNPAIYREQDTYNPALSTGSLSSQVEVDLNRGGLTQRPENLTVSQDQLQDLPVTDRQEGDRAGTLAPSYQEGDEKVFYCSDPKDLYGARIAREFTCRYVGTYCNIWVADVKLSDKIIQGYGQEFDAYIYPSVSQAFGQGRFTENGGKVNLLYYPIPEGIGGFFSVWDLYSSYEVTPDQVAYYGLNTDHAIVHINGKYANYQKYPQLETFMYSVMAHEYQHLICATNAFENGTFTFCDTWINEAMSGYIEETLYQGVKENSSGHLSAFYDSDLIRNGQSLYNFGNTGEDVGVYGSVYLYSAYVAHLAGQDVFSNFHRNWRNSYDANLTVAKALVSSVPQQVYTAVDEAVPYPASLYFATPEEAWMSKLTLCFYLELMGRDGTDPAAFQQVDTRDLLYNEVNPANIEGGGRIIIALSGGEYVIPADADDGLIYVGLNEDFQVATPLICKG